MPNAQAHNQMQVPEVFGPIAQIDAELLAKVEPNSVAAKLILRNIGATAAEGKFALVADHFGRNDEFGTSLLSLNPQDLGTEAMPGDDGKYDKQGLPTLPEVYEQITRERDSKFQVTQPGPKGPNSPSVLNAKQMMLSAADRQNRKAAGLPPRVFDLR